MQFDLWLITIGAVGLIVGSITDLQKREVADWVNYSLLFAGLGLRALYAAQAGNLWYLVAGIIGAIIMFSIALFMYYTGQWGGGDAKMLMGLGALFATFQPVTILGMTPVFGDELLFTLTIFPEGTTLLFLPLLFINIMIAGAIYGLLWSLAQAVRYRSALRHNMKTALDNPALKKQRYISWIIAAITIIIALTLPMPQRAILLGITAVALLYVPLRTFIKAVETSAMIRTMSLDDITEGEWVTEEITHGGRKVADARTTITADIIKKLDTTACPQVTARIWSWGIPKKISIPLYQFDEEMTLCHPLKLKTTIPAGRMTKEQRYQIMEAKIHEDSRRVSITRKNKQLTVHFSELIPGDVLNEDLYSDRTTIIHAKNLGVDRYQIDLLRRLHKRPVTVRVGIPFIPAFLVGFFVTITMGNPFLFLL